MCVCVCAAHQIKQSQRTAVSCTATKETKNKFALRAKRLSAGQSHRQGEGGRSRRTGGDRQHIQLSYAPNQRGSMCHFLMHCPAKLPCLLVKLNLNSNLNRNSCTNFKFGCVCCVDMCTLLRHMCMYSMYVCVYACVCTLNYGYVQQTQRCQRRQVKHRERCSFWPNLRFVNYLRHTHTYTHTGTVSNTHT